MKQQIHPLAPPTRSTTRSIHLNKGDHLYKTCWAIKASLDPPHSPLNQTFEHTDRRGWSIYSTNWSLGANTQRRRLCSTLFTRSPWSSIRPNCLNSLVF